VPPLSYLWSLLTCYSASLRTSSPNTYVLPFDSKSTGFYTYIHTSFQKAPTEGSSTNCCSKKTSHTVNSLYHTAIHKLTTYLLNNLFAVLVVPKWVISRAHLAVLVTSPSSTLNPSNFSVIWTPLAHSLCSEHSQRLSLLQVIAFFPSHNSWFTQIHRQCDQLNPTS